MNGHAEPASAGRWWAGIFVGFVLSSLGALGGVILRHEGTLGRWDARIDSIQRTIDRIEGKVDELKGKK